MQQLEVLAVIPARISSKRVPEKNIAMVTGKPLLCYTVAAALEAKSIGRVVVSTESLKVAEIARGCGAEVPFMRPQHLAEDHSSTISVCLHAVSWLDQHESYRPDYIMYLNPTNPLRTAADIDGMIQMAQEKGADAVWGACPIEHRSSSLEFSVGEDGRVTELSHRYILEQGVCPPLYGPGGGMSLIRPDVLKDVRTWFPSGVFAYVIPRERILDIDLPYHLYLANLILEDIRGSG